MDRGAALPPARERNRCGIRAFTENPPSSAEALFDRVELRVRGTIEVMQEHAIDRFAARIGLGEELPPIFGPAQRYRGSWISKAASGSLFSGSEIAISRQPPSAEFVVRLSVNPLRTLAHLLDRFTFDEFESIPLAEFFAPTDDPTSALQTLDGRDNMVSDFRAFAGSVHEKFVQRVATFHRVFERNLRTRLILEMCPPEQGYEYGRRDAQSPYSAWNEDAEMRLDWGGLTVSQAEACWERHDPDALAKVHALADGVLSAARSPVVRTHPRTVGPSVERDLGALSVRIPLTPTGHIVLVIYAKAADRLRIEVRYLKNLPDVVRELLPQAPRSLTDWFDAIRSDAAPRVRWSELHGLLRPPEDATIQLLSELLQHVADVTDKAKAKRRTILQALLLHGGLTATNRDGEAPFQILERLADRGVIEHLRFTRRDAKTGRRYRLTDRYRSLVGRI